MGALQLKRRPIHHGDESDGRLDRTLPRYDNVSCPWQSKHAALAMTTTIKAVTSFYLHIDSNGANISILVLKKSKKKLRYIRESIFLVPNSLFVLLILQLNKETVKHNILTGYILRLGNISILYRYRDMRRDIILDFGYRNIVIWYKCCLLFKGYISIKWRNFLNLPDCSSWSIICHLHFVMGSTLMMIIYQKSHCVNILWKHQLSILQYRRNIDIEVFGQKYCDIWFPPSHPALIHLTQTAEASD